MSYTRGPWRVYTDDATAGDPSGFMPFGGCGCCGSPWMTSNENGQADANLIAAAPDLLEALQLAINCHGIMLPINPPNDAWKYYKVSEKARAAIAKAKGETND